jgi:hypothetical protein
LLAEVGQLRTPLAVLAGPVITNIDGAFRPTPEINAEAAIDLILRLYAFTHNIYPLVFRLLLSR